MALQYETTKEHTITVTGYEGTIRHLVIPDQVDGCPVKTIGKNAFSGIRKNAQIKVPAAQYKKYKKLFRGKGQGKKVVLKKYNGK